MYIRNKVVWLRKQGWDVLVISANKGNAIIPELREFDTYISEMLFPVYMFSIRKQSKILSQVIDMISPQDYDEIIIESTCIEITTWAEVVAKEIKSKHISYLLQEMNIVENPDLQEFFKFKHKRRELAGIKEQSLLKMFEPFFTIPLSLSYKLSASCTNVVEDIDTTYINNVPWHKYDYKIGCLSRIDKPFIKVAVSNFTVFAQNHKSKRFLLFMIGGAPENTTYVKGIKDIIKEANNVDLIITGYMFPISTKLLECFDAFFSSAGSSRPCMRAGVPTITIDANDFAPIGILRHTTQNSIFRGEDEPILDYQKVFEEVIIEKKYKKFAPEHEIPEPSFIDHMKFIENSVSTKEYFEISNIKPCTFAEKKLKIGLTLLGASNYKKLNLLKTRLNNLIC